MNAALLTAAHDQRNQEILRVRIEAYSRVLGPRVGDYLRLTPPDPRCPNKTRFTHIWDDHIQTGGRGGFYLGLGYCSYSGSLDPGIKTADLIATTETLWGAVWFFDCDIRGAGRGVHYSAPFRVFLPKPGADLDGVSELRCPFRIYSTIPGECDRYGFLVYREGLSHTAFKTEGELRDWLEAERLSLSEPLTPGAGQSLAWGKGAA